MDKKQVMLFLNGKMQEVYELETLPPNNADFPRWYTTIENFLLAVFGKDNWAYTTFKEAGIMRGLVEDSRTQYLKTLKSREVALASIIDTLETLGDKEEPDTRAKAPPKAFISHGKESVALGKLKEFIETLGIEPLIVKKQASIDKDLPDKVNLYLSQADFIIILATGDDEFEGKRHPRQNVIHEIGLAQKTHPGRIVYLLEEGAEFPSNIRPKVWESFKQRNMMDAFLGIVRELRAYGILKVTKFPVEEQPS